MLHAAAGSNLMDFHLALKFSDIIFQSRVFNRPAFSIIFVFLVWFLPLVNNMPEIRIFIFNFQLIESLKVFDNSWQFQFNCNLDECSR